MFESNSHSINSSKILNIIIAIILVAVIGCFGALGYTVKSDISRVNADAAATTQSSLSTAVNDTGGNEIGDTGGNELDAFGDIEVEETVLSDIETFQSSASDISNTELLSYSTSRESTTRQMITFKETVAAIVKTTQSVITSNTTKKPAATKSTTKLTTTTTTKTTTQKHTEPETTKTPDKNSDSTSACTTASSSGTFVFTAYGFGHGVGMSQDGAIAMAKSGSNYKEIVKHYYPSTTLVSDNEAPETVKYGGKDIPLVEYICRTVQREIGSYSTPVEAMKAQACTVYTYAKYYNFNVKASQHAYASDYEYKDTRLYDAVLSYLEMQNETDTPSPYYVAYNGKCAVTYYCSSVAGKTAGATSVWGGKAASYLNGGVTSPEKVEKHTFTISADELRTLIMAYNSDIVLSDNPADWIQIVSHDSAYSSNIGYADKVRIGNKTILGNEFRAKVMNYKIRSHCFTLEYIQ